jgi:1-acyl-sn-glycerol-3-phosphate acyltransferase
MRRTSAVARRHLFHFLHNYYWRVEIDGLDYVPRQGRGVLVGVHRGFMPFDGVMALYALVRKLDRIPRFLIHPSLTKFPFLGDFMAKLGGIMACQENGDYILQHDELLGVFPEGIRGAFTMASAAIARQVWARRVRMVRAAEPRAAPALCHGRQRRDLPDPRPRRLALVQAVHRMAVLSGDAGAVSAALEVAHAVSRADAHREGIRT